MRIFMGMRIFNKIRNTTNYDTQTPPDTHRETLPAPTVVSHPSSQTVSYIRFVYTIFSLHVQPV